MKINIKLDSNAVMPTRAHDNDAGMDLYAPEDFTVPRTKAVLLRDPGLVMGFNPMDALDIEVGSAAIDTGVHVEIPAGYAGMIKSKSGLNVNKGLTAEGVIDSGYTGSICVKLYNHTSRDVNFKRGDKITQLVIMPCLLPELNQVDRLEDTDRGDNGFGSTGK